jgi:hypothetical protein
LVFHSVNSQILEILIQTKKYNNKLLCQKDPNCILYLAVPLKAYKTFFKYQLPQKIIQRYHFKRIVYDTQKEGITEWIN